MKNGAGADVLNLLSHDRLAGFKVAGAQNDETRLLGRYLYNLALSEALYPYLHTLEVVLRNRIDHVVSRNHPIDSDRPDLYAEFPTWLDATKSQVLPAEHRNAVDKAKADVAKDLTRRWGSTRASQKSMRTPGRLVAKLTLSFWVYLFDKDYAGVGRGDLGILWPRYLHDVFPHRDAALQLVEIRAILRRVLVVRNRMMHFERISPWADHNGSLQPDRVRRDMLRIIRAMAPRASQALERHGPDPVIFEPLFERYMRRIAAHI